MGVLREASDEVGRGHESLSWGDVAASREDIIRPSRAVPRRPGDGTVHFAVTESAGDIWSDCGFLRTLSMGETRILNWNVEWASPRAKRFPLIRRAIEEVRAEVNVVTEGSRSVLPNSGHVVTSSADYGYAPADQSRRKVFCGAGSRGGMWMWMVRRSCPRADSSRGTTDTGIGAVRFIVSASRGVMLMCDPDGKTAGRGKTSPLPRWTRGEYLRTVSTAETTIIAGDFNQRIPAAGAPARVSDRLAEVFRGWQMVTADVRSRDGDLMIDHMAIRPGRSQTSVSVLEGSRRMAHECRTIMG